MNRSNAPLILAPRLALGPVTRRYFGTRGEAPERTIAGYPEDALRLVE